MDKLTKDQQAVYAEGHVNAIAAVAKELVEIRRVLALIWITAFIALIAWLAGACYAGPISGATADAVDAVDVVVVVEPDAGGELVDGTAHLVEQVWPDPAANPNP